MLPNAVVDASVLVSAFLFPASVPGQVVGLARHGLFRMFLSSVLLVEIERSLLNPRLCKAYRHDAASVAAWCEDLREIGTFVDEPLPDIGSVCRDPNDDHVLAAAVSAGASWIVTGDKDLLTLGQYRGISIVGPHVFLDAMP